ncbi:MAG: hypothetical protein IPK32_16470 [Verrucomicrobiaceae bacterium]|nr:hypothetical protein [Verrucomicrobiaceae bacterium]
MKLFLCLALLTTLALADDSAKLAALLEKSGVVTIPAGDYHLDGTQPIPPAIKHHHHGPRRTLPPCRSRCRTKLA